MLVLRRDTACRVRAVHVFHLPPYGGSSTIPCDIYFSSALRLRKSSILQPLRSSTTSPKTGAEYASHDVGWLSICPFLTPPCRPKICLHMLSLPSVAVRQNLTVLLWGTKVPVVANIAHSQCPLNRVEELLHLLLTCILALPP